MSVTVTLDPMRVVIKVLLILLAGLGFFIVKQGRGMTREAGQAIVIVSVYALGSMGLF